MALTKIQMRPGINREVTRYSGEGGWRDGDKVRFRQGYPEKIGGWQQVSGARFKGVCRSLIEWSSLAGVRFTGVGTNLKYYIALGGVYRDITPIRAVSTAGAVTFAATDGLSLITVSQNSHGAIDGDFVTFTDATPLGGQITATVLNREHQVVQVLDPDTYTIDVGVLADTMDTNDGGAATVATYQINTGPATQQAFFGWGAGPWGFGSWGNGVPGAGRLRIWNHDNYGEDLIFGPRGGPLYYWAQVAGLQTPGFQILGGDTPVVHLSMLVSDISRFVICFGCNELGETQLDPMLVRWSDQEQFASWTPAITNQAGGQRLSSGSTIVTAIQNRQEILVWTDTALYSMQYQGPPYVWGFQLMGENVSIAGPNAVATANGVAYWMGVDKFYMYDGRVQPLPCDLQRAVFNNINAEQTDQICCGTNEQFHEIWWHYPTADSMHNNRYVVYNYLEGIWYYGSMQRSAWLDSAFLGAPLAAFTDRLVQHEVGVDDLSGNTPQPIPSFIASSEVDIGDGDKFAFVRRVLPDITFEGSTATNPSVVFELQPLRNSGSGFTTPASVGGSAAAPTVRTATAPVQQYTQQLNIRVRGRQIAMRVSSTESGVKWQLGSPRVDILMDGYNG